MAAHPTNMRFSPSIATLLFFVSCAAAIKTDRLRNPHRYRPLPGSIPTVSRGAPAPVANARVLAAVDEPGGFRAPRTNVWAPLSIDEAVKVGEWLHTKSGLNLTAADNATAWDNKINFIELLRPNKTDVLPWLAGERNAPARWARALIVFGATNEPYMQDYAIGPLPISEQTQLQSMDWWSTKGNSRIRVHTADPDLERDFVHKISAGIDDITRDLLNTTVTGTDDDTGYIGGIDPVWHQEQKIVQWMGYWRFGTKYDASYLLPQGLYMQIETTGRDPKNWKHLGWFYNGEYYTSSEAFRNAWKQPGFKKATQNVEGEWVGTDRTGTPFAHDEKTPPMTVLAENSRFDLDVQQQYVQWGDFAFYVSFSRDTGLRLFDIRYGGERIIYELGLEEALAHYAGNDPVQSGITYLDTYFGMGLYSFELVPGYDCPGGSKFLNATIYADELITTHRNAICMFEMDKGYPIQRHSADGYVTITKNIAFVLKNVATVGNYDYTFTYTFYQDGSIETAVQASGYIQSAFYAHNEEYGYKIHDALSGSMHDHVIVFKADIDILGTNNTLAKHTIVPATITYPWSNGIARNTMKMERSDIENENEGKLNWAANAAAMYVVVNKDAPNKYGEPRGYRIMPSSGTAHLAIINSTNLVKAGSFATHDLFVTRRKDTEPHVVHPMNALDPADPIVDFARHFDGESLVQEDIVLHFNLGMHHIPHTGDLPNTVMTTAHSSMMITPHNYLLSDASRRSRQQVRINFDTRGNNRTATVTGFGAEPVPGAGAFPTLDNYVGRFVVRKWPYDPLNPFDEEL